MALLTLLTSLPSHAAPWWWAQFTKGDGNNTSNSQFERWVAFAVNQGSDATDTVYVASYTWGSGSTGSIDGINGASSAGLNFVSAAGGMPSYLIGDGDGGANLTSAQALSDVDVTDVTEPAGGAIMHIKDVYVANKGYLISSANHTSGGWNAQNNNAIYFRASQLPLLMGKVEDNMQEMASGTFHDATTYPGGNNYYSPYGDTIELRFSPEDNDGGTGVGTGSLLSRLRELAQGAKESIFFMSDQWSAGAGQVNLRTDIINNDAIIWAGVGGGVGGSDFDTTTGTAMQADTNGTLRDEAGAFNRLHSKTFIFDMEWVTTGSANMSAAATYTVGSNDEVYILIHDFRLARRYMTHFHKIMDSATPDPSADGYDTTAPAGATALNVTATDTAFYATWTPSATADVSRYYLFIDTAALTQFAIGDRVDDDADGYIDEDPRGDYDGFPSGVTAAGAAAADDDADGAIDEDLWMAPEVMVKGKTSSAGAITTWNVGDTLLAATNYFFAIVSVDTQGNEGAIATFGPVQLQAIDTSGPNIWYVNDTSTTGDSFTQAIGQDTNNGLTVTTPFRTLNRLEGHLTPGDTIYLDAGFYYENDTFTIDTNGVFLIGKDSASSVIRFDLATASASRCINVRNVNGLVLQDFKVTNGYIGIGFINVDTSLIERVTSSQHTLAGISFSSGSDKNILRDVATASNLTDGININASSNNTLDRVVSTSNATVDIFLIGISDSNTVTNSTTSGASYGIKLDSSDSNVLTNNSVSNHVTAGIELLSSDSNTLKNNTSSSNAGLGISLTTLSSNNSLVQNTVTGNASDGIYLFSASNSNDLDSNVSSLNAGIGYHVNGSNGNILRSNISYSNSSYGIGMFNANNNRFAQNYLDSNGSWGFYVAGTSVTDSFVKNSFVPSPYTTAKDSFAWNATASATIGFDRNFWSTTDSAIIGANVQASPGGAVTFLPFRLGVVDTTVDADTVAPQAPDTVAAETIAATQIRVSWSRSLINEEGFSGDTSLAGYRVYRSATSDTTQWVLRLTAGPSDQSAIDSGLSLGETWYYRVTAFDTRTPFENQSFYSDSTPFARTDASIDTSGPNIWYVNDTSLTGDIYTTAIGYDTNLGYASNSPFRTLNALEGKLTAGDTIYLDAGFYYEPDTFTIDTNGVFLVGKDSTSSTVRFPSVDVADAQSIYAQDVTNLTFQDFRMTNGRYGIAVKNVDSSLFERLHFDSIGLHGLLLSDNATGGSDSNIVRNVKSSDNVINGMFLNVSHGNLIEKSTFSGNRGNQTIYLQLSNNNTFRENFIDGNRFDGFFLNVSDSNMFLSNVISRNGGEGIDINNTGGNIFTQNTFDSNAGWVVKMAGTSDQPTDTFNKNIIIPSQYVLFRDSGIYNNTRLSKQSDYTLNWWGTSDSADIIAKIHGQAFDSRTKISFEPFRLGIVDTAIGADTVAPRSPDTVAVSNATANQLTISWDTVTLNEYGVAMTDLGGFNIYRSTNVDTSKWDTVATVAANVTSYADVSVNFVSTYYYRITAFDTKTDYVNESFLSDSKPGAVATIDTLIANIWYVNDTSLAGDIYATAIGYDTNNGYDPGSPFRTLNALEGILTAGDTIYLDAGFYYEVDTLTIDTNGVFVIGKDSASTIIAFNDPTSSGARGIHAANVNQLTLRNFRVTNGWRGVLFDNVDSSTIEQVRSDSHGQHGILLDNGSNGNTLTSNTSSNNDSYGFDLISSSNNTLTGNTSSNNFSSGFFLTASSNSNTMTRNTSLTNAGFGFHLLASSNNVLTGNMSLSNSFTGFKLQSSSDNNTLMSNISSNNSAYGFNIQSSSNVALTQNTADSNGLWGFYLDGTSVTDTFSKNSYKGSPTRPDSGIYNNSTSNTQFDFTRIWWETTDTIAIYAKIHGQSVDSRAKITYTPFRLGAVDTATGADTLAPDAPDTVAADTITATTVKVSWKQVTTDEEYGNPITDLAGYNIYRATADTASSWTYLDSVASGFDTYVDATASGTVYYRVTAFDTHTYPNEAFFSDSIPGININIVDTSIPNKWYINDASTAADSFTTAVGSDANSGLSPGAPLLTLNRVEGWLTSGDTVYIDRGVFLESDTFTIDTDMIWIIGVDSSQTVVDFNNTGLSAFRAIHIKNCDSITLQDFGVTRARHGILLEASDNNTIQRVTSDSMGSNGIYLKSGSDTNTIANFDADGNSGHGIVLDASIGNSVTQSRAANHTGVGIFLSNADGNTVSQNFVISNTLQGILLQSGSDNNTVDMNTSTSNTNYGIHILNSDGNIASNNTATGNSNIGIILQSGADNNIIIGNTASNNTSWGIFLNAAGGNRIVSNLSKNNQNDGFYVEDNAITPSNNNYFAQNTADSNAGYGFHIATQGVNSAADTFHKNIYIPSTSPAFQNMAVGVAFATFTFDFTRNWWSTTDSSQITSKFGGAGAKNITFEDFRLGKVDTAVGSDSVAPAAPDTVAADTASSLTVILTWDTVASNEDGEAWTNDLGGFAIYRSQDRDTTQWFRIDTVNAQTLQYTDTNVVGGETYFYRVTSYDTHFFINESYYSDSLIQARPESTTLGTFNLTLPIDNRETNELQITFRWDSPTYTISPLTFQLIVDTDLLGSFIVDTTVSDTEETIVLPRQDTYLWRVIATAGNGDSITAGDFTLVVDTGAPTSTTLNSPKGGIVVAPPFTFDWDTASDSVSGVGTYQLQVDTSGSFTGILAIDSKQAVTDTVITTLSVETYYWRIIVIDDAGNTTASGPETIVVTFLPDSPSGVSATAGDLQVGLNWYIDAAVNGYDVWRATDTNGPWSKMTAALIDTLAPNYTDTTVINDSWYYYIITSEAPGPLTSDSSPKVSAYPLGSAPSAPTGLTAAGGSGKVTLTWTANSEPDLGGYKIYRAVDTSANGFTQVLSYGKDTISIADTGLTNDSVYYYKITAFDTEPTPNESDSNAAVAATPSATDTTAPAITHTAVTTAQESNAVSVTSTATDNKSLSSVRIFFRQTGEATWQSDTLTNSPPDSYNGAIPADSIRTAGADYYLRALDASGNYGYSGNETNPHHITVTTADVTAPTLYHTAPTQVTTGSTATIAVAATDASGIASSTLLYRITGTTTFISTAMALVSDSLYRGAIPRDSVTAAGIDYRIDVSDFAGNSVSTGVFSVPAAAADSTAPTITHTPYTSVATGSTIVVTAQVTDDVAIDTVTLFFGDSAGITDSAIMTVVSGNNFTGIIPATRFTITSETYRYYIYARDTAGNTTEDPGAAGYTIAVTAGDTASPVIQHSPTTTAAPGNTVTLTAVITDDSGLPAATLYWRQNGATTYQSTAMTEASGLYSASIPNDSVTTVGLQYAIGAIDSAGNGPAWAAGRDTTNPLSITVTTGDVTPPVLSHTPIDTATESSIVTISAVVTDNIGVSTVTLFHRDSGQVNYQTAAMTASGNVYSTDIAKESVTAAGIEYYISASDAAGNAGTSGSALAPHQIVGFPADVLAPILIHDTVTRTWEKVDKIMTAEARDSDRISSVVFYYKFEGGAVYASINMTLDSNSVYQTTLLAANLIANFNLQYYIIASDVSGNTTAFQSAAEPATLHVQAKPADVSEARTFPNPWTPESGEPMTIHRLPPDPGMIIEIYDRGGGLVDRLTVGRGIQALPDENIAQWAATTLSGKKVATGTYMLVIRSAAGVKVIRATIVQ